jgi:hypothetical protein
VAAERFLSSPHRGDVVTKERVDALQVAHAQLRQLAAAVLRQLHRRAADVVCLTEGHACREKGRCNWVGGVGN